MPTHEYALHIFGNPIRFQIRIFNLFFSSVPLSVRESPETALPKIYPENNYSALALSGILAINLTLCYYCAMIIYPNQRFDLLTVIKETGKVNASGYPMYKCKCDCGNTRTVSSYYLRYNRDSKRSCGKCLLRAKDRTGVTFGSIQAVKNMNRSDKKGNALYQCRCTVCGHEFVASLSKVKRTGSRACKICYPFSGHVKDIRGKLFGRLTAVRLVSYNKIKQATWLFNCSCGNTCEAKASHVIRGLTRSCGCIKNKSGCVGVCFDKNKNKWIAYISYQKHCYVLGRFAVFDEAVEARKKAEVQVKRGIFKIPNSDSRSK